MTSLTSGRAREDGTSLLAISPPASDALAPSIPATVVPTADCPRSWRLDTIPEHAEIKEVLMTVRSVLTVPGVLLAALALALTTPGTAHGQVDSAVSIAGTLSGPSGVAKLGVSVRGTAEHLSGTGGSAHVTLASPATFTFDGALDGSVVTLHGHVAHAAFEFLEGTPVTLTADASTGRIDMSFGPVPAGPLAGQTLAFTGTGKVTLTDPRVGAVRLRRA
jgi:hypothetical protein